MAQKPVDPPAPKKVKDVVHEDRNWVTRVHNELDSGDNWNKQWSYLSGGINALDETSLSKPATTNINDRINELESVMPARDIDHPVARKEGYANHELHVWGWTETLDVHERQAPYP